MNDFNNGTDMLKTAAETAKRNIMNIKNTIYDIEPQIIKLFLEKINNSKVDIKQIGKLWLARSVKNQNVRKSFFDKEGLEELILKINAAVCNKAHSVQFSHSVVSDSLQPHESQHASPPCPSPTPGVHLNSCPLSR